MTLRVLPPKPDEGLGLVLDACLRAARSWHTALVASDILRPCGEPELDIVTFFPDSSPLSASAVDAASARLFERAMNDEADPIFLSLLRVQNGRLGAHAPDLVADRPEARILRSVLMKPEHEYAIPHLHQRLEQMARA